MSKPIPELLVWRREAVCDHHADGGHPCVGWAAYIAGGGDWRGCCPWGLSASVPHLLPCLSHRGDAGQLPHWAESRGTRTQPHLSLLRVLCSGLAPERCQVSLVEEKPGDAPFLPLEVHDAQKPPCSWPAPQGQDR